MSIIEEIYNADIGKGYSSKYMKQMSIISECEEKLNNMLNGESKELFQKVLDAQTELEEALAVKRYSEGFRVGSKLVLELLIGDISKTGDKGNE